MACSRCTVARLAICMLWMLAGLQQLRAKTAHKSSCYNGRQKITFTKYDIFQERNTGAPRKHALLDNNGKVIAKVDDTAFFQCGSLGQGTCSLSDGRIVNVRSTDPDVFVVLDRTKFPYGIGPWSNPLEPFVSVANMDSPPSTKLFVRELRGFKLPNGKVHNGCVRVDDRGRFDNCHIDLFVNTVEDFRNVNPRLPQVAHVSEDPSCRILSYV